MKQILFFDGVCLLCNGFVDFLLKRDVEQHFLFAPIQGRKAHEVLPPEFTADLTTVVLWSQGQILTQSDAVLTVVAQLGGIWSLARAGWIVPKGLRDLLYRLVAGYRYSWFGKKETCRLPAPEERTRFLE